MGKVPFKLKSQGSSFKMMGSSPVKSDAATKAYRKMFGGNYDRNSEHFVNWTNKWDEQKETTEAPKREEAANIANFLKSKGVSSMEEYKIKMGVTPEVEETEE